jgi:1-acyl-sn-glycerol-3-phosphate acyltransferase
MLAPPLALAWATAYTIRMSQRAMLERALGAGDDRIQELVKEWSLGLTGRMKIEVVADGVDGVDWSRPLVLMANHQSYLDVMALYRVLPRCFGFIAKKSLYNIPFFSGVMDAVGCIPIDRGDRRSALTSMREAARILRSGKTIAIFPEGTRSPGDRILPLKKGSFHLVQLAQVPAVPIGIRGAGQLMPRQNTGIRSGVIEVHVGKPIPPPPAEDQKARAALMSEVRSELARLAGVPEADSMEAGSAR